MVKAAQMTQDANARYFVVDSEEKLMLLYTPANEGADAYQEVARSKNTPPPQDAIVFPALKLTFRIFQDQHEKDAVDSCKYVKCPDVK
jgi:hypothetical protein